MENFNLFIDYIARTNLFNFIIFLSIIIFLVKKVNVSAKLTEAQEKVVKTIEDSESVKDDSETRLSSIEKSMANLDSEIESIIAKSEENAKLVGEKVLADAEKTSLVIKDNAQKSIEIVV